MRLRDHEVEAILGIRGAGKSHYTKTRRVKNAARVAVWDPQAEYGEACDLDEYSLVELFHGTELLEEPEARIAIVPEWSDPADLADGFAEFFAALKDAKHEESLLVVVEECGLLRPRGDGTLVALAAQSRHWRMPLVLVSQRATMQPPGVRAQWSRVVSFRQSDPGDIDALAERIGAEKAARVARLQRRKFVEWDESEAFRRGGESTE